MTEFPLPLGEDQIEETTSPENPSEKYRLIYEEIGKARDRQFGDIGLINQKLNWVLVSASVVFVAFFQSLDFGRPGFQLAATFLFLSICACLYSLFPNNYKSGPSSASILKKQGAPYGTIIRSLNKRIAEDVTANQKIIFRLNIALAGATMLLVLAMSITLFLKYH